MNNDLISREALKKQIKNDYCKNHCPLPDAEYYCPSNCSARYFIKLIDNAPTVEYTFEEAFQKTVCENKLYCPARPKGKWIKITRKGTVPVEYICSCCGRKIYDDYELSIPMSEFYPFCHCGADMRKGDVMSEEEKE